MFYLAMSYGDNVSITSGFDSREVAYNYLAAVVRYNLSDDDEDWDEETDENCIYHFFNEVVDNGNWIITDHMLDYNESERLSILQLTVGHHTFEYDDDELSDMIECLAADYTPERLCDIGKMAISSLEKLLTRPSLSKQQRKEAADEAIILYALSTLGYGNEEGSTTTIKRVQVH